MTENSYNTPCGCIHYFVNIIDKQKITLVFLPGLTADHRLFEKQTEYFEKRQNVFVWDAPSFLMKDGSTKFFSAKDQASLTVNGKAVSLDNASYNVTLENDLPVLNVDEAISVVASAPGESGGSISFIEPDYYPDYDEKDDTSEAPVIRDDSDTAPKTADAPILPTLLLAALSALVLVRAKKRLCR